MAKIAIFLSSLKPVLKEDFAFEVAAYNPSQKEKEPRPRKTDGII
jgi:hypothetical protein